MGSVPAKGAETVGEAAIQRPGGVDADKVEATSRLVDFGQHAGAVGEGGGVHRAALPGGAFHLQIRVRRQLADHQAQLHQAFGQALAIAFQVAGEGDGDFRAAVVADQAQAAGGLGHVAGLAYLGPVETDEFGFLCAVPEAEILACLQAGAQAPGQGGEAGFRVGHHWAPPKTSTCLKTHAGEAWPTCTTWFGSPLPQYGVPRTSKVLASPTAARLRQKRADTPR
ncbi:hypothetical protein D9M72_538900 [compost metagenome]